MLKNHIPHQTELEMFTLEDLVPAERLVRKIEPSLTLNSSVTRFAIYTTPTVVALRLTP